ncbi:MAG: hypothetical protein RLZZ303_78 [Candidatus Hydrogenedentota bacterium]|jgi:serine/threonine protein kinase
MTSSPHNKPNTSVNVLLAELALSDVIEDGIWLRAQMPSLPPAGWKLHISSVPHELELALRRAVPILLAERVPFKCIATPALLEDLNDGRFGVTQAGKAITLYPRDESEAHRLCQKLASQLQGLRGPEVVTDTRFAPDAPVYFRYGPYDGAARIDLLGRQRRQLQLPSGELIDDPAAPDPRLPAPSLLPGTPPPDHLAFLREHYLFVQILQVSAKGTVLVGLPRSSQSRTPLLIKTARCDALCDPHGRDAVWALQREHACLQQHAPVPGIPQAGTLLHSSGHTAAALVRPYINGPTLIERWQSPNGNTPATREELARWLKQAALTVETLHADGLVVRDLSPSNLIHDGHRLFIADLELAHHVDDSTPPYRRGTRGYYDPTRPRFAPAVWQDDAYALLSLAHQLHTGVHPQWTRLGGIHSAVPVPTGTSFQAAWQSAATAKDPKEFFPAFHHLLDCSVAYPPIPDSWNWNRDEAIHTRVLALQRRCDGLPSKTLPPDQANVFTGLAGEIHVLAALQALPQLDSCLLASLAAALDASAAKLAHIPGHHFGAPGIALALLHLAHALPDPTATRDAARRHLLDIPWESATVPDHCHGLAGYLQALHLAAQCDNHPEYRARIACVEQALFDMSQLEQDCCCWPWPEGPYTGLSGARQYGYAHGAAGILAVLAARQSESPTAQRKRHLVAGLHWLAKGALEVEGVPGALWWPVSPQDDACWNAWSHGTPGVVKALSAAVAFPPARALLPAALAGLRAANNAGYCLCHGIASRLDACLDAALALGDTAPEWLAPQALADAAALAALDLAALEARERPEAGDDGVGYMKGAAGVVLTLSRFDHVLRSGGLRFPAGLAPVVQGQILAR